MSEQYDVHSNPQIRLPTRMFEGHKGTFGTVLVIGGCAPPGGTGPWMAGAPALAARAAFRSGAGLVRVLCPTSVAQVVLTLSPSATVHAFAADCMPSEANAALDACIEAGVSTIAIGPGLGRGDVANALVYRVLRHARVPVVVDADAIHAMAHHAMSAGEILAPCVLTPHAGEALALARGIGLDVDRVPTDEQGRVGFAEEFAQRLGCVMVLKGAGSVVTDGHETWVCPCGHPCLGTGGTGDVLTGVVAAVLAHRYESLRRASGMDDDELERLRALAAARVGRAVSMQPALKDDRAVPTMLACVRASVLAHACAGEAWVREHGAQAGLLAQELCDLLPVQLEALRPAISR